jgi:signal transduction histidine kinase
MSQIQKLEFPEYNRIVQSLIRSDALLSGQRKALELLAKRAPLFDVLHLLVALLEEQYEGLLCSILIVDEESRTFRAGVEVSDAKNYSLEIRGVSITPPYVGPCCMAAHTGEKVLVEDIEKDLRWQDGWRDWALKNGLKSCRSHPIFSSSGKVLGTFALYHKEHADPTLDKLYQTELTTHIAGIAIERKLIETQEVEQRKRQQQMNEELSHALNLRDEFLSIASHELKAPLTTIKLQAQVRKKALQKGESFTASQALEMMEFNEKQIDRVTQLIETMLDLSRFSSGRLEMRPDKVALRELIDDVVSRLQPQLDRANCSIDVVCDLGMVGEWDQFRMEQVFINLITNAIKYGPEKPIHIVVRQERGSMLISVEDQGIGIAPEDHDRIFNRYERVVPRHASVSGLGLGLYIVKGIVEAHGGRIWVESGLGQGARFIMSLPERVSGATKREPAPSNSSLPNGGLSSSGKGFLDAVLSANFPKKLEGLY